MCTGGRLAFHNFQDTGLWTKTGPTAIVPHLVSAPLYTLANIWEFHTNWNISQTAHASILRYIFKVPHIELGSRLYGTEKEAWRRRQRLATELTERTGEICLSLQMSILREVKSLRRTKSGDKSIPYSWRLTEQAAHSFLHWSDKNTVAAGWHFVS